MTHIPPPVRISASGYGGPYLCLLWERFRISRRSRHAKLPLQGMGYRGTQDRAQQSCRHLCTYPIHQHMHKKVALMVDKIALQLSSLIGLGAQFIQANSQPLPGSILTSSRVQRRPVVFQSSATSTGSGCPSCQCKRAGVRGDDRVDYHGIDILLAGWLSTCTRLRIWLFF